MLNRLPLAAALALLCQQAFAQVSTRPEIEINHAPQRLFALTNARVAVSATDIREGVTLVIDDGRVREILPTGRPIKRIFIEGVETSMTSRHTELCERYQGRYGSKNGDVCTSK